MGGGASVEAPGNSYPYYPQVPLIRELSVSVNPSGESVSYSDRRDDVDPRKEGYIIGTVDMAEFTKLRLEQFSLTSTNEVQATAENSMEEKFVDRQILDPRVEGVIIGSS